MAAVSDWLHLHELCMCPNMALGYLIAGRYVDVRVILGRENLYAFVLNTTAASALRQKGAEDRRIANASLSHLRGRHQLSGDVSGTPNHEGRCCSAHCKGNQRKNGAKKAES